VGRRRQSPLVSWSSLSLPWGGNHAGRGQHGKALEQLRPWRQVVGGGSSNSHVISPRTRTGAGWDVVSLSHHPRPPTHQKRDHSPCTPHPTHSPATHSPIAPPPIRLSRRPSQSHHAPPITKPSHRPSRSCPFARTLCELHSWEEQEGVVHERPIADARQ